MPENREDKTFIPIGYLDKTLCSILLECNQFLHSLAIEALLFYNLYTEGYTFMYRMKMCCIYGRNYGIYNQDEIGVI